jgi:hypothetical protein
MLTRGLKYPLTTKDGNLATSFGVEAKAEEIKSVLETRFFERVMRANYGTSDYALTVLDPYIITSQIQNSITENVSGLASLSVRGDWKTRGEEGIFNVVVTFSVPNQNEMSLSFSLSG